MDKYKEMVLDKAYAKIEYHKNKLNFEFTTRHAQTKMGYNPYATVKFHVKEIRTWAYIRSSVILRG